MEATSKTRKKNIPRSINEMSKEMLQVTLRKKKECNAKALSVVESLCEATVCEEWFLENLQYINQCHFEDVIDERAILKLCGYPLCSQNLGKISTQQYHISTRYNKVFDVTERKKFCSSSCYKAALYVKKQLFTSPLWFRDQEVIPKYVILNSCKSSLGEEIVFLPDKIKVEPDNIENKNVSVDNVNKLKDKLSNISLSDSKETKNNAEVHAKEAIDNKLNESSKTETDCTKSVQNESDLEKIKLENSSLEKLEVLVENKSEKSENIEKCDKLENQICETVKLSSNISVKNSKSKTTSKVKSEPVNDVAKVENSIFEWFSIGTMIYLYDENKLKEILSDRADEFKEVLKTKPLMLGSNKNIDKMIQLFGLLNNDYSSENETRNNLKPLPDYSALKEEGKTLEIKVKAFYKGDFQIKQPEKEEIKKESEESQDNPVYLPLVDAHSQLDLRRKIVLDKLNKILPELIRIFSTDYVLNMTDVRNLVGTFSLDSHNITFKPPQWYLMGLILVKLLSIKDRYLELILQLESSQKQMTLLFMNFNLPQDYLNDIIHKLTDSKSLIKKLEQLNA